MTLRTKLLFALLGASMLGAVVYFYQLGGNPPVPEKVQTHVITPPASPKVNDADSIPTPYSEVEFSYVMEDVMPGSDLGTYPKLTSHTNSETLKRINTLLDEDRRMFGCSVATMTEEELKGEFLRNDMAIPSSLATLSYAEKMELLGYGAYARTEVLYDKKSILSMRTVMEYVCGGPYPVNTLVYKTYDVANGARVELPAVFRNFTKNQDEITKLFNKYYASEGQGGECGSTLPDEAYLYAEFFVSDKGFFISPSLPHVSQACGGDIQIPLDEIKPYLAPNSILFRL